MFLTVLAFPVLLIYFFSSFLRVDQRKVCVAGWLLAVAFSPFVYSEAFLQPGGSLAFLPSMPRIGPLFVPFNIVWFGWIFYDFWLLARGPQGGSQPTRKQVNFLLAIFIGGYVVACTNYLYLYRVYIPVIHPFATYGVSIAFLVIAYGVFAYNLFDINVVIRRSLVYSILVTLLTTGYFGLVYAVERFFQVTFGYQSVWVSLGAFAMMALAFQPLKIGIQRLVDWLLFRTTQEELVKRMERLEQEACQTEQLKAVATLAAGMAHEIRNPLSSLKTFAEYLPKKYDEPEFREKFSRIMGQEIGKVNELVQRLLDFAKPQPPQKQRVRVSRVVDETVEFLHGALVGKRIEVVRGYSTQDAIWADPTQLKQAFLNVLLNSIQAMERPGCITVSTVCEDGHLDILVADTGPGIAKEHLPRVFDPFYTTKPEGTGLGLSVVHSIMKEHGGRVLIDSREGGGTTVRMQFPTDGGQG